MEPRKDVEAEYRRKTKDTTTKFDEEDQKAI